MRRQALYAIPLLLAAGLAVAVGYQPNMLRNLMGPVTVTGDLSVTDDLTVTDDLQAADLVVTGTTDLRGYTAGEDAGFNNVTASGVVGIRGLTTIGSEADIAVVDAGIINLPASGNVLTAVANAKIKWPGANETLYGTNGSGPRTDGDFTVAGTLTSADYRPAGTTTFDLNSHTADGTTAFTFDWSTNATSGLHSSFRRNGTTAIATIAYDGAIQAGTQLANEVTIAGAIASSPVTVTATGADTDIDVNAVPKGAGSLEVKSREVAFYGGTGRAETMTCYGTTTLSGGAATVDFTDASCEDFAAAPSCWVDTKSATRCYASDRTATGLTLTGNATDVCDWLCIGATP